MKYWKRARLRVLYLTHRVPFPPDKGDRIRSYHTLRHLAADHDVYLLCLADEPVDVAASRELARWCCDVATVPVGRRRWVRGACSLVRGQTATEGLFASPVAWNVISEWSARYDFDVALAFCSSMTQYLDHPGLRYLPAIADLVDLDSQKWLDYAASVGGARRQLFRLEGRRLRHVETALTRRCHAITFVSDREADLYRQAHPNNQTHVVPNGVDFDHFSPGSEAVPSEPFSCVFLGALDYLANVDGALWFVRNVWTAVKAKLPSARLFIVGRNPVPPIRSLARDPSIQVFADVPDVRPYLAKAAVAIVPLRIARGVQNKVLEAMAMQRPVVATPQALGGIAAVPGEHLLSAASPDEWTATLMNLLADEEQQRRLASAARRLVMKTYDWSQNLARLTGLIHAAASEQPSTAWPAERLRQTRLPHVASDPPRQNRTLEVTSP